MEASRAEKNGGSIGAKRESPYSRNRHIAKRLAVTLLSLSQNSFHLLGHSFVSIQAQLSPPPAPRTTPSTTSLSGLNPEVFGMMAAENAVKS